MPGPINLGMAPLTSVGQAVLAIGRPDFPEVLLGALRRKAGVGHCMLFIFDEERSVRCQIDVGNIPIGPDLGLAYSDHFHLADPNRDFILEHQENSTPLILPAFAPAKYGHRYRTIFFKNSRIVDKFAVAIWAERTCFYLNCYRTHSQGRFVPQQLDYLINNASVIVSAVANHALRASAAPKEPLCLLEAVFSSDRAFAQLTNREREVCLRILTGLTSKTIATDLGISIQSTLTYRKRAYAKLCVSSQNELFKMAIRSLACRHAPPQGRFVKLTGA